MYGLLTSFMFYLLVVLNIRLIDMIAHESLNALIFSVHNQFYVFE